MFFPRKNTPEFHSNNTYIFFISSLHKREDSWSKACCILTLHQVKVGLDELEKSLKTVLCKILIPRDLQQLTYQVLSDINLLNSKVQGRHSISECFEGSLDNLGMRILQSQKNTSQNSFLLLFLQIEVELFELLTDESDGQNRNFFYYWVIIVDVLSYFLDDSRPLITRNLDAANCCNYLY